MVLVVSGLVQGVGFRPFIHGLAHRLRLNGDVANGPRGVTIRLFGHKANLRHFLVLLRNEAPPLARIDALSIQILTDSHFNAFRIITSRAGAKTTAVIPADIATCADCLREMNDHSDRRFAYPFINCTNCGPRLTIVESLPYDRPGTVMRHFPLCDACLAEYRDPASRRFHAEAMACPVCGPRLTLVDTANTPLLDEPIPFVARALAAGKIVALRGLGGFHLAVDAENEIAVMKLRSRKNRPDKPFALMAANIETAIVFCQISVAEQDVLYSPEAPIVVLRRLKTDEPAAIADGLSDLGLMLPTTPLHHLLFADPNCPRLLLMTSGNVSGAPIAMSNAEALRRLSGIADYFLLHDREILTRLDDSLVALRAGRPRLLRRSRGFVPAALSIPWSLPPLLACGPGMKNTITLASGRQIHVSQHVGDLEGAEIFQFYQETIAHHQRLRRIEPRIVVRDLHPDYLSSHYADELGLPVYKVQHHHAHAVAVMAEHGISGEALALALDGVGLGDDGSVWGGEILAVTPMDFRRLGHLSPLPAPGGDAAAREIWRLGRAALFLLAETGRCTAQAPSSSLAAVDAYQQEIIDQMLAADLNCPRTSSAGRLFDAVASLIGIRQNVSYEGQAAMELEALALQAADEEALPRIITAEWPRITTAQSEKDGQMNIDGLFFIETIIKDLREGEAKSMIALRFHALLIVAFSQALRLARVKTGLNTVLLCGGCMQNRLLLEGFTRVLGDDGFTVFSGEAFPAHDGAVSIGQAVIGGLRHVHRHPHAGAGC
ncbi:MAG: carbamoyltransferase HypF [Desulfobulbaceae bacterium]|nr:carbamoyltransferase HypF [Desulfobulbaceae bacterium]